MLFILSPKPNRASVHHAYLLAAGRDPFGGCGPRGSSRSVWQSNHSPSDLFKRSPLSSSLVISSRRPRKTPKERSDASRRRHSPIYSLHHLKQRPIERLKSNSEGAAR